MRFGTVSSVTRNGRMENIFFAYRVTNVLFKKLLLLEKDHQKMHRTCAESSHKPHDLPTNVLNDV